MEFVDRLLPFGQRVTAHQGYAAIASGFAELAEGTDGLLELAEQDHLVLDIELGQQFYDDANFHLLQKLTERAEPGKDRAVLEADAVVLAALLLGERHRQRLPLLAL
ncbi:hypothetical protein D3C85_1510830 [compost metagenome]